MILWSLMLMANPCRKKPFNNNNCFCQKRPPFGDAFFIGAGGYKIKAIRLCGPLVQTKTNHGFSLGYIFRGGS